MGVRVFCCRFTSPLPPSWLIFLVLFLSIKSYIRTEAFVNTSPMLQHIYQTQPHLMAASFTASPHTSGQTLLSFLFEEQAAHPISSDGDLHLVLLAISSAVKTISHAVRRAGLDNLTGFHVKKQGGEATTNQGGERQKKLDVLANDILKEALHGCGQVAGFASEEEDGIISLRTGAKYLVVVDPLDGSSNVDASIPTGTIFGVYRSLGDTPAQLQAGVLQAGKEQVAAGYCLFSAATLLVMSMGCGTGTHVFTLDPHIGDFILTHRRIRIPERGSTYSLNEARHQDWPQTLQRYVTNMKLGQNRTRKPYALVYVCSLVADAHWLLFRGGMACNPRSHLRLCYEGNPMGLVRYFSHAR